MVEKFHWNKRRITHDATHGTNQHRIKCRDKREAWEPENVLAGLLQRKEQKWSSVLLAKLRRFLHHHSEKGPFDMQRSYN